MLLSASALAGSVKLATLDWEPSISHVMANNGFVAEVARDAFNKGLASMKADGTLAAIMKKSGF